MGLFHDKRVMYIGGGVGLLILILLLRHASGSSGTVAVASGGMTDAQLNAATSIQLAQIGAASSVAQTNAKLAEAQAGYQADLAKTGIEADLTKYTVDKQSANDALSLSVNAQMAEEQTAAQLSSQKYLGDLTASVTKYQLDTQAKMQASNNEFQLGYAEAANSSAEHLALIQAGVIDNQLTVSRDITEQQIAASSATVNSSLNAQTEMARISANKDVEIAQINKPKKPSFLASFLGGVVGALI